MGAALRPPATFIIDCFEGIIPYPKRLKRLPFLLMMYTSRLSGKPTPLNAVIDMVAFDSEVLESELLAMRHEREELNENAFKQIQELYAIRQALVDIKNEHQRMI
ncbi:hypothetical protein BT69DRAFT_303070 [Atractiella rhizophila]|nr:hypothetical protein BT69DRAFT_303070 [Atractiella rhizophila]